MVRVVTFLQLQGMLSPFGELKDCVVIIDKMSQKSKVGTAKAVCGITAHAMLAVVSTALALCDRSTRQGSKVL